MAIDPLGLYPLSTPGGNPIPFEICRPVGLIRIAFATAVSGQIVIPASAELLVLSTDKECIVRLGANASIPASGSFLADSIELSPDTFWVVDPNGAAFLTVIRVAVDGTLVINALKKWQDIQKPAVSDRT